MGFLDEVVRATRAAVEDPAYLAGLPTGPGDPGPSLRDAVLRERERGALIVEFKRTSPGSPDPELPVRSVSEFVDRVGAAPPTAYSCIASVPRFHGRPEDVAEMRRRTELPILFKDFVVGPAQLDAARRGGASAILLIARLARGPEPVPLIELSRGAHERGLEVLLEFHDRAELKLAEGVAADMYGVNVRDLDTLRIERAEAEATLAAAQHLRPLLGLSGVDGPAAARRFWELDVDGLLVGSAVARAPDPARFVRSLRRSPGGDR